MQNIFVQIKCELGKVYEVAEAVVDNVEEAEDVYSISGAFDLMVKFHLGDDIDIGRFEIGIDSGTATLLEFTKCRFKFFKGVSPYFAEE